MPVGLSTDPAYVILHGFYVQQECMLSEDIYTAHAVSW